MKQILPSVPGFISRPCLLRPSGIKRDSMNVMQHSDSLVSVVSAWKCVLRMFTASGKMQSNKDVKGDMFDILDSNDDRETLMAEYEVFKSTHSDFETRKNEYLRDLFLRLKSSESFSVHKVALLTEMLQGIERDVLKEAIYLSLNTCKNQQETNILLVAYEVIMKESSSAVIPMMASVHDIYKNNNVAYSEAVLAYKREMYKAEIRRFLDNQMEEYSKTSPHEPPPVAGSTGIENQKAELLQVLGKDVDCVVPTGDGSIYDTSKEMLKQAWTLEFLNKTKKKEAPASGWSILMMDKAECQKVYEDLINEKLEDAKQQVLLSKEKTEDEELQEMPKLAMLAHSRQCQLRDVSTNVTDWERIGVDRIRRLQELYKIDLKCKSGPDVPLHKAIIGGGKARPQNVYVNPEDDPNYEPPGSTAASRMMRKMLSSDDDEDTFVPTDLETREKGLEMIAKEMEPYEHLTSEQLSDIFLRNCKKEYELAEVTFRRLSRDRIVEDEEERRYRFEDVDINNSSTQKYSVVNRGNHRRGEQMLSRNTFLTEAIAFLSALEHLQWQYTVSVVLPMESLVHVKDMGDSSTNPRPPKLNFVSPRCREAYTYTQSYIKNTSKANVYRDYLRESVLWECTNEAKRDVNNLLLFGDDPLFYLKDQEMLQHMLENGVGLEIHSKVPGLVLPNDPSEYQKDMIHYRLTTSQPHPQAICSVCGYHIFSHPVKAHDGESLTPREQYEIPENGNYRCPSCDAQTDSVSQYWVTGSRGYAPEPYPTPIEDEFERQ
ncbi:UDP-N-acetylmuramoyl-L-alanyl-D-glutamate synthetase, putative [Babesia ovis]|uniref:UDP-N-acetylmuramoyl-L-alanyl-D-glutamate synthetase, putative n=1 Tax=Babesia ovis TaxID=5869 RepID=A0A9W5TAV5_BABOV|nr:UDP-N-acetylmuramoyl-L-alanyl-D-glutamate synthetase, putative [Babesia ovis]